MTSLISNKLAHSDYVTLGDCKDAVSAWLLNPFIDQESKGEIETLIDSKNIKELRDRFYRELEFGTGGLRGINGAGNNRMNKYVVRRATQGLANFIASQGEEAKKRGIAIAYDSRIYSEIFAKESASVMAANGISSHIFKTLQTTPNLSFAIRHLKCISGICVTASHNPPQYSGFKVYWEDGAQIIAPQDTGILIEVAAINDWAQVKHISFDDALKAGFVHWIDESVIEAYSDEVASLQLHPEINKDINIVYTPLHGTGGVPTRRELKRWGYKNLHIVAEQEQPNGLFPTVAKPNPEEPQALSLAAALAEKNGADIIVASDPDSDRLALVVRDEKASKGVFAHQSVDNYVFLNGNQTGALMIDFLLKSWKEKNRLKPEHKVIKTIVTSDLHARICARYGVEVFETLTGFKWIAGLVRKWENDPKNKFIYLFGTEESFGYMPGTYVRDKDGIAALCQAVEMCQVFKNSGRTAIDALLEIFKKDGAWQEDLLSVDLEGEEGAKRIGRLMEKMRAHPKTTFDSVPTVKMSDYKLQYAVRFEGEKAISGSSKPLDFPKSDVLQFDLKDGSRISMRPSGTEPKIKFYISVCTLGGTVSEAYSSSILRVKRLKTEIEEYVKGVE